ncbi:cerebellar degeneration-related protein 2 [Brienomyrus brachyistius]|uniref:cerebellar degeneration-related protein 2 n=1 Tax=Brienomyrus brachyistius TaxID=42636 RepID=UPI0020B39890|nr:cerebellar degeneration-related protein 2 [Brienomyrus brachyistius]
MLTDVTLEQEFEGKKDVSWYDVEDVKRDLHLAAELGKTLLERNHELEAGLRQMYSTNQEQLQEIEYLSRQVELLRQMSEQHTKVYDQLELTSQKLEQDNHRLVLENRMAQQKIQCLSETIEGLQTQMMELQKQVEDLKPAQPDSTSRSVQPDSTSRSTQLGSGNKDPSEWVSGLASPGMCCMVETPPEHDTDCSWTEVDLANAEEENAALKVSLQTLRAQLRAEETRRQVAEQEVELAAQDSSVLGQRLAELEGCWERRQRLEQQVEELRRLWSIEAARARARGGRLSSETLLTPLHEEEIDTGAESGAESEAESDVGGPEGRHPGDGNLLRSPSTEDLLQVHERFCARRSQAVRPRGSSLLRKVDEQYSALQARYDALLSRCQQVADGLSHTAVQTAGTDRTRRRSTSSAETPGADVDTSPPEYRALFQEIFNCIRKTREDLSHQNKTATPTVQ